MPYYLTHPYFLRSSPFWLSAQERIYTDIMSNPFGLARYQFMRPCRGLLLFSEEVSN